MYMEELAEVGRKWHITAALLNLGNAVTPFPNAPLKITLDGKQAVRLLREIDADVIVPLHFESWTYLIEHGMILPESSRRRVLRTKCAGLFQALIRRYFDLR